MKVMPSIAKKIGTNKYGRRSYLFLTTINKALWDLFWLTKTITDREVCLSNTHLHIRIIAY